MEIEYDPEKNAATRAKHGVSLALGAVVLENRIGEIVDDRWDYGERRINAFGLVAERLFVCTYTARSPHSLIFGQIFERRVNAPVQTAWA